MKTRHVVFATAVVVGLLAGTSSAAALWSDQTTDPQRTNAYTTLYIRECGAEQTGCTPGQEATGTALDTVTSSDPELTALKFDKTDALNMDAQFRKTGKAQVIEQVTLYATGLLGDQGVDFTWAAPTPVQTSWVAHSTLTLWTAPTFGTCDYEEAVANALPSQGTLVSSVYSNTAHGAKTVAWTICAALTHNGPEHYANTVTGYAVDGETGDIDPRTASWAAIVIPDATQEPDYRIPIRISITEANPEPAGQSDGDTPVKESGNLIKEGEND